MKTKQNSNVTSDWFRWSQIPKTPKYIGFSHLCGQLCEWAAISVNVAIVRHRQPPLVAKIGVPTGLVYSFHSMRIAETQHVEKMIAASESIGINPDTNAITLTVLQDSDSFQLWCSPVRRLVPSDFFLTVHRAECIPSTTKLMRTLDQTWWCQFEPSRWLYHFKTENYRKQNANRCKGFNVDWADISLGKCHLDIFFRRRRSRGVSLAKLEMRVRFPSAAFAVTRWLSMTNGTRIFWSCRVLLQLTLWT